MSRAYTYIYVGIRERYRWKNIDQSTCKESGNQSRVQDKCFMLKNEFCSFFLRPSIKSNCYVRCKTIYFFNHDNKRKWTKK